MLVPHVHSRVSPRISGAGERPPSGPATAGAQPRSPVSEGAVVSGLAFGAAAGLESVPAAPKPPFGVSRRAGRTRPRPGVRVFKEGSDVVYLHPLTPGVQVIAGTVLGHVGAASTSAGADGQPHIVFQIRPSGAGAPLIDPKPILDGWVALDNTSIFRADGENPFLATTPTVGQVLLESKQQLQPQVLHDAGIRLGDCGRRPSSPAASTSACSPRSSTCRCRACSPTVSGLKCDIPAQAAAAANAPAGADSESVDITAVNGIPIAGHQGPGLDRRCDRAQAADAAGRQQAAADRQPAELPGRRSRLGEPERRRCDQASASARPQRPSRTAQPSLDTVLKPSQWIQLIARLGEIPDPTVVAGPSPAAIPDTPGARPRRTRVGPWPPPPRPARQPCRRPRPALGAPATRCSRPGRPGRASGGSPPWARWRSSC